MRVLSLGWGVQSWTIAAMSALGELPKLDVAIHSDTTYEHEDTYAFAQMWRPWLEQRGIKVVVVSDATQVQRVMTDKIGIPAFTINEHTGSQGQLRRQCTDRWKIRPIRRFIRAVQKGCQIVSLQNRFVAAWHFRVPIFDYLRVCAAIEPFEMVEQWLGISLDEVIRAKDSDVQYITNCFPLLDKQMSRADCIAWLTAHDLPVPPKSSCVFCPYHSRRAWQELKRAGGGDWEQAMAVDEIIRYQRSPYSLFVHTDRKPLEAVTIAEDFGYLQLPLIDTTDMPCDSGHCFL